VEPLTFRPFGHDLWADASAAPVDGHIDRCSLAGLLAIDSIPTTPWASTTTASVGRTLIIINQTELSVSDTLPALRVEASYPAPDSVMLVLSGPYVDTLRGAYLGPMAGFPTYGGPWSCPPRFPYGTHPALRAAGYNPTAVIEGQWRLWPLLPIG
jgi:hypothetical protein